MSTQAPQGGRARAPSPKRNPGKKPSRSSKRGDRQDGGITGDPTPTLKNAYAAANYIREVLHRASGIKTYPINGFALHVICGLEFKIHHDVELVANSDDLFQIEKLLEKEKQYDLFRSIL
jgi:hypothetical protein